MKKVHSVIGFKKMGLLLLCFFFLFPLVICAQGESLFQKGKIIDENGVPIIGANIVVKGSKTGAISDLNGNFSIQLKDQHSTLILSYIGYKTVEMPAATGDLLEIKMSPIVGRLDDVVVIGYGTVKKRDVSTSMSSINAEEIAAKPIASLDQAMAGKMAGVRVAATSAAPGAGQSLIIRGIGSISASTAPLYVVDGMPLADSFNKTENPLSFISTSDIESIEVLKDASASSIYGARASNGVVLITTKRGKSGNIKVSFNASSGFQSILRDIPVCNASQFKQYINDSRSQSYVLQDPNLWNDTKRSWSWNDSYETRLANLMNSPQNGKGYNLNAADGWLQKRWFMTNDEILNNSTYTDWQNQLFKSGKVEDYQFSINGGNDKTTYLVSANYFNQDGLVKTTGYERFAARANIDFNVNKWFKFGINLSPSYEIYDILSGTNVGNGPSGIIASASIMPPIWSPYDSKGNSVINFGTYSGGPYNYALSGEYVNPFLLLQETTKSKVYKNIASFNSDIIFSKDLKYRGEFHTEMTSRVGDYFRPAYSETISNTNVFSYGWDDRYTELYWNTQHTLTYNKQFNKHNVSLMAGFQAEKNDLDHSFMQKRDFITNQITTLNSASTVVTPSDVYTNKAVSTMVGLFGRMMYNYEGKYYATFSLRNDASSKFGADQRWGTFPSFSLAWRISDEKFMSSLKNVISDWKLRGGWGKVGNSSISDYLAYSLINTNGLYSFGGSNYAATYDGNIANQALGWETTEDFDLGTDLQFLNGRIGLEYDYFNKKTNDMLFTVPVMLSTGFSSQQRNIAKMQNRGMEFSLHTKNFVKKFKWNTDMNIYYVRNKVLDLGPEKNPLWGSTSNPSDVRSDIGKPISNIWGYYSLGTYKDWEQVKTTPLMYGNPSNQWERSIPGDAKYADVNGDGIIDDNDMTVIGNPQPNFVWAINNDFSYKNFDISVMINGVNGGDINLRMMRRNVFGGNLGQNNVPLYYYNNYWRPDRTDAQYEAPSRKTWARTFNTTTKNVESGTYVNINNVTLGYTLPKNLLSGIDGLRLFVNIQNLYMFTKYHGYNPEANTYGNSATTQGADDGSYPLARTFNFGVNLKF